MPKITLFDLQYAKCLEKIMNCLPEKNTRTGKTVRALHGITVNVNYPHGIFPIIALRDIRPEWACAEAVWFMSGDNKAAWMDSQGFKAWAKWADENGLVSSATGFRWRHAFGVDQFNHIATMLALDSSSRHGVLQSWDPREDCETPGPNVPCLVSWHFHITERQLHLSILQRSADMFFGFPHDILGARIIQELLAAHLNVGIGGLLHAISNAHLYEDQWQAAEEMILRSEDPYALNGSDAIEMAEWAQTSLGLIDADFTRALVGDKKLPWEIAGRIRRFYDPCPAIRGPHLAV